MYRFGDECGMCCSMTAGAVRGNTNISTFIEMCVGRFIKEFKSKRSLDSELSLFFMEGYGPTVCFRSSLLCSLFVLV